MRRKGAERVTSTTSSGRKRKRSFALDVDILDWLQRLADERRSNPNALANQFLAAAMDAEQAQKDKVA